MVGCNLGCSFCQNREISQWPKEHLPKRLEGGNHPQSTEPACPALGDLERQVLAEAVTPADLVAAASRSDAGALAYTYTEPIICPACRAKLFDRYGFFLRENQIRNDRCPDCGEAIDGVGMAG